MRLCIRRKLGVTRELVNAGRSFHSDWADSPPSSPLRSPAPMTGFTADIAQPAKNSIGDPAVAMVSSHGRTIVALFDGWGTWGMGYEAAARTRSLAEARWGGKLPDSIEAAAEDVHEFANSTPAAFHDDMDDCSFHGVILLLASSSIHVAAAGAYAVALASPAGLTSIFKPQTLLELYQEKFPLSEAEAEAFPHKNVFPGPYLASSARAPLVCSGPHQVPAGGMLVVANADLLAKLSQVDPTSWAGLSARALQELEGHRLPTPLVVVRQAAAP
jgi:hypothetical protein